MIESLLNCCYNLPTPVYKQPPSSHQSHSILKRLLSSQLYSLQELLRMTPLGVNCFIFKMIGSHWRGESGIIRACCWSPWCWVFLLSFNSYRLVEACQKGLTEADHAVTSHHRLFTTMEPWNLIHIGVIIAYLRDKYCIDVSLALASSFNAHFTEHGFSSWNDH